MIKAAFILPHCPLLIPMVGKRHRELLKNTLDSYELAKEKMKKKKVDTIVIFSSHLRAGENPIINIAPEYDINFLEFGDGSENLKITGRPILGQKIKELVKNTELSTVNPVDHAASVPLFLLSEISKESQALIISPPEDLNDAYKFGLEISKVLKKSSRKIAILAAGDLSQAHSPKSPAGYSNKAGKYDNKIIELLKQENSSEKILNLDKKLISDAKECGLRTILCLLGAIEKEDKNPEVLSYQNDFGVGNLSMEFDFSPLFPLLS